ncbi:MAG: hypothetical protein KC502_12855 [Myxococcales bacterium]|nr:hypothetical protein [Myxococcales bacterium]
MRPTLRLAIVSLCSIFVVPAAATATVPTTSVAEGVLTSAGGGPAADGSYAVTFSIYSAKGAKTPSWQEPKATVTVKGGRFSHVLGTSKPLSGNILGALGQAWLGIQIGSDPELPRTRLHTTLYAAVAARAESLACSGCVSGKAIANGGISATKVAFNYAGSASKGGPASNLACSACVSVSELKFDGDVNLGSNSIKAKNATFTGDVAASTVTATAFVGNGAKLTGIKIPSGTCSKAGEVVKGINPDGSLKCIKSMDASALPSDGLNEISNNLLTNQFVDIIETKMKGIPIPDKQGKEAVSNITVPDLGIVQAIEVRVHVENTDLSTVAMTILPPNDKKVGWTLCDPCGKKDAKIFKKTYSPTAKPKSGDMGAWIGKNAKGLWNLKVLDSQFCVKQAPGNDKYCNLTTKTDGWIATWSFKLSTKSTKKVAANGVLDAKNGMRLQVASKAPVACDTGNLGYIYYNSVDKNLYVCDGKKFDIAVQAPLGSENKPAPNCKSILTAGESKGSGVYWIDPDSTLGPIAKFQAWCDMVHSGGGWMLVWNLDTSNGAMRAHNDNTFWTGNSSVGGVATAMADDYKNGAAFLNGKANEVLIVAHAEGKDWNGKQTWARYTLNSANKGKPFKTLMNSGNNRHIGSVSGRTGEVAKNKYSRNAGDVFIDHGLPMIINSTGHGGTDADNFVRIGTDFKTLCGVVSCNGHNVQGGYGGYHHRNGSYPLTYEAMPTFGYHPGPMGFGNNFQNNKGCGQSVWSNKCGPTSARLHVDFGILIR